MKKDILDDRIPQETAETIVLWSNKSGLTPQRIVALMVQIFERAGRMGKVDPCYLLGSWYAGVLWPCKNRKRENASHLSRLGVASKILTISSCFSFLSFFTKSS